jgi:hypothetical protein
MALRIGSTNVKNVDDAIVSGKMAAQEEEKSQSGDVHAFEQAQPCASNAWRPAA